MENSTEVPQKINSRTTIWARNSTSMNKSKDTKALCQRDICTMFLATLFTTAKTWKQHKCLSTHEGGIYTVEYWKVKVKVAQLGPTLCDPMDCIVHGTLQARILEWVAFPFSRGSSQPSEKSGLPHCRQILYQLSHKEPKNTGVGSLSLFQQIFPTQESNRGLLHHRQIL